MDFSAPTGGKSRSIDFGTFCVAYTVVAGALSIAITIGATAGVV